MFFSHLDHDRKVSDFSGELLWVTAVDSVFKGSRKLATIRSVSLSAFGRKDLSLLCKLVARRNLALEELYALVSNAQAVPAAMGRPVIAIEEDSSANVGKTPL
jgi:hypothetical protein